MATGSAEYQVGVKLTGDATDLKSEITSATTAIGTLDTTVSQTSDSIVNTSGRKLKSAGKTIGTDFAQSITSGISSGDLAGSVSGIFSSLSMVGGIAALGVGLGGALITGIIKGANANATEMRAGVNELLKGVEDDFKGSMKSILQDLQEGVSSINVLEELGGGGEDALVQGLAKAREYAQGTGLELEQVVEVLQGKMRPATQAVLNKQLDQLAVLEEVESATGQTYAEEVRRKSPAGQLIDLYKIQAEELGKAKDDARDLHDIQASTADIVGQTAQYAGAYAAQLERADAAARLLAGRRLPSSDSMNGI
jgi:hypothetical protein